MNQVRLISGKSNSGAIQTFRRGNFLKFHGVARCMIGNYAVLIQGLKCDALKDSIKNITDHSQYKTKQQCSHPTINIKPRYDPGSQEDNKDINDQ